MTQLNRALMQDATATIDSALAKLFGKNSVLQNSFKVEGDYAFGQAKIVVTITDPEHVKSLKSALRRLLKEEESGEERPTRTRRQPQAADTKRSKDAPQQTANDAFTDALLDSFKASSVKKTAAALRRALRSDEGLAELNNECASVIRTEFENAPKLLRAAKALGIDATWLFIVLSFMHEQYKFARAEMRDNIKPLLEDPTISQWLEDAAEESQTDDGDDDELPDDDGDDDDGEWDSDED